jgi:DNA helicase II / ATP-dependent DNA helicase PcrA
MSDWIDIRRKARDCHQSALGLAKGERRVDKLLDAALKNANLVKKYYERGTIFNEGVVGVLDRASELIYVQKGLPPEEEAMVIGHELGHFYIHTDPLHEIRLHSESLGGDPVDGGVAKVEGYSPTEKNEVQANVFADEFLCPSDWLRTEYVERGQRPAAISVNLGIPISRVVNQLIRALLLPPVRDAAIKSVGPTISLDASQQKAATWEKGPLLVDAGPGTGKTRTLVHRVKHYFDIGSSPASILALTFSNKAAEEMRERISKMDPEAAVQMWVSTFHSFGWEIIKKWPSEIGRSEKIKLLDEADALALLEDNLDKLELHYYQNLYEPAIDLVAVLRAISRCKDEMITPEEYRRHATEAWEKATDDKAQENAGRSLEIAGIYEVYEQLLREADAVDFGDLVSKPVVIMEKCPAAKKYIAAFKHILVDEYQDVNLASSRLLQEIAKCGAEPWVVADQRQSIYRFRGAEPSNVARFEKEFGGHRRPLDTNYRSFAPVVRSFEHFSAAMGGRGPMAGSWIANRGDGGAVSVTVTPDVTAEAELIQSKANFFLSEGVPYSDQVLLARTHLNLGRITSVLEKLDVPLLYLGDLFERAEVRDLLSLLALGAEPGNIGFPRVAALPEYGVDKSDALSVMAWAETNKVPIFEALMRTAEISELSPSGRTGLAKLGVHLAGLQDASPWSLLSIWLFERSNYLQPLLTSKSAKARQNLIAIYHFLKVCSESTKAGRTGRRQFLKRIRRIEALNQDAPFRAVSSEASDIDAIRVMTIHGSKGLEFGAVHFPAIATRYMPKSRSGQSVPCPPPPTLSHLEMDANDHDAEEEGLFFVGLSRARDFLSLSRAEKYSAKQNSTASKFLAEIGSHVAHNHFKGSGTSLATSLTFAPCDAFSIYPEKQLATYIECPARFRQEVLDQLRGVRDDNPYVLFHRCVYITVDWLERERVAGHKPTVREGLARLATVWSERGPLTHGFEPYYRRAAESMVSAMCEAILHETGQYARAEWQIPLSNGIVSITPDRVLLEQSGLVRVQRTRTGKKTKSQAGKAIYALLRKGTSIYHPGKPVSIEIFYLTTGEVEVVPAGDENKKLREYDDAIAGIKAGDFNIPSPLPRFCPNCPAYFVCGTN